MDPIATLPAARWSREHALWVAVLTDAVALVAGTGLGTPAERWAA